MWNMTKTEVCHNAAIDDRATAAGNMHRKFTEVWASGFWDMLVDTWQVDKMYSVVRNTT